MCICVCNAHCVKDMCARYIFYPWFINKKINAQKYEKLPIISQKVRDIAGLATSEATLTMEKTTRP